MNAHFKVHYDHWDSLLTSGLFVWFLFGWLVFIIVVFETGRGGVFLIVALAVLELAL